MATKTLKGKFLPQYRTAAQWSAADTVLLRGEIGVESDTRKFKFGDGTTSWNSLGYAQSGTTGGSGGDDIIVIPEGTPVNDMDYYPIPRDQGAIIPIVIKAGAESAPPGGYEYVGTVQYIYGGNNPEMMINVCAAESDMIARNEWYQAHIDTEGISAWVKMGGSSGSSLPFDGPIPGYTKVCNQTNVATKAGNTQTIPLIQSVPVNTYGFIEADVVTAVSGGTVKTSVPLMFFRFAEGATICDINSRAIASEAAGIGQLKVNLATFDGSSFISVVTSNNMISPAVLLIKGIYAKIEGGGVTTPYYLRLDGEDEDSQWVADADGRNGTAYTVTSNGTPYIVSFDSRLSVDLYEADGSLHLSIAAPENTGTSGIDYDPVILGIREDSSVRRQVAVSQLGREYFLTLNGNSSGFSVNATADGEVMELTCRTNGTPQIQQFEGDAIDSVDIQGDVISIATLPNSSTDSRNAVVVVCLEEDPAISITVSVVQAGAAASYYLTVDEEEVTLSSSRQTYSVSCNTNGTVIATVMDLEGFISATVNANTLNISVTKNNTGSMRTGSIKLRLAEDSTVTAIVSVFQEST